MVSAKKMDSLVAVCAIVLALGGGGCGNSSKSSAPTTPAEQAKDAAGGPIPASVNAAMEARYGTSSRPIPQGTQAAPPPASVKARPSH